MGERPKVISQLPQQEGAPMQPISMVQEPTSGPSQKYLATVAAGLSVLFRANLEPDGKGGFTGKVSDGGDLVLGFVPTISGDRFIPRAKVIPPLTSERIFDL